ALVWYTHSNSNLSHSRPKVADSCEYNSLINLKVILVLSIHFDNKSEKCSKFIYIFELLTMTIVGRY
ncbi:MAG: hypothetical protein WA364_06125, partial [Candidatus Nitrosopolaris sp.]